MITQKRVLKSSYKPSPRVDYEDMTLVFDKTTISPYSILEAHEVRHSGLLIPYSANKWVNYHAPSDAFEVQFRRGYLEGNLSSLTVIATAYIPGVIDPPSRVAISFPTPHAWFTVEVGGQCVRRVRMKVWWNGSFQTMTQGSWVTLTFSDYL